jgi:hypothetical protein
MEQRCAHAEFCGDTQHSFQAHLLRIRDEAFTLLIFVNYATCWSAKQLKKNGKPPLLVVLCLSHISSMHFVKASSEGGFC